MHCICVYAELYRVSSLSHVLAYINLIPVLVLYPVIDKTHLWWRYPELAFVHVGFFETHQGSFSSWSLSFQSFLTCRSSLASSLVTLLHCYFVKCFLSLFFIKQNDPFCLFPAITSATLFFCDWQFAHFLSSVDPQCDVCVYIALIAKCL